MPNITLSIRDKDILLWADARRHAEENYTTLSGVASLALANYLRGKKNSNYQDIVLVAVVNGTEQPVVFKGRWLVHPDELGDSTLGGIAETVNHRIAVYYLLNGQHRLANYDTLNDAYNDVYAGLGADHDEAWTKARLALTPPLRLGI